MSVCKVNVASQPNGTTSLFCLPNRAFYVTLFRPKQTFSVLRFLEFSSEIALIIIAKVESMSIRTKVITSISWETRPKMD